LILLADGIVGPQLNFNINFNVAKIRSLVYILLVPFETLIDDVTWASSWRWSKEATNVIVDVLWLPFLLHCWRESVHFPTITQSKYLFLSPEIHQLVKMAKSSTVDKKAGGRKMRILPVRRWLEQIELDHLHLQRSDDEQHSQIPPHALRDLQ